MTKCKDFYIVEKEDDDVETAFNRLLLIILFAAFFLFGSAMPYVLTSLDALPEEIENILVKNVPVEVEKEVVKYVEKTGMKTSDFVLMLNPKVDPVIAEKIGESVDKHGRTYQLPRKLVLGIIKKESYFNPFAKSKVAIGLMQIYPKYHQNKIDALGIKDQRELYHIDKNIEIGCQIFREYLDQANGDLDEAFHKYLSKNATKEQKDAYMNSVLTTYALLDIIEFQHKNTIIKENKEEENQIEKGKENDS
jgi:hypothetical protein